MADLGFNRITGALCGGQTTERRERHAEARTKPSQSSSARGRGWQEAAGFWLCLNVTLLNPFVPRPPPFFPVNTQRSSSPSAFTPRAFPVRRARRPACLVSQPSLRPRGPQAQNTSRVTGRTAPLSDCAVAFPLPQLLPEGVIGLLPQRPGGATVLGTALRRSCPCPGSDGERDLQLPAGDACGRGGSVQASSQAQDPG